MVFVTLNRLLKKPGEVERTYMNGRVADSDIPIESCSGVELGGRLESPPQRHAVPGGGWGIV